MKWSVSLLLLAIASAATIFLIAHGLSIDDCTDEEDLPHWFYVLVFVLSPLSALVFGVSAFLAFRRRWYMLGSFIAAFGGFGWFIGSIALGFVTAPSCPT